MFSRFRNVVANVIGGNSQEDDEIVDQTTLEVKHAYSRPHFLQLSHDEVALSTDHEARPIVTPRDISILPWYAGYAEVINAGKSKVNEDQAAAGILDVKSHKPPDPVSYNIFASSLRNRPRELLDFSSVDHNDEPLYCTYFHIFDGHAGTGASLMAAHTLHHHIKEKLSEIRPQLMSKYVNKSKPETNDPMKFVVPQKEVTIDDLIIGALESSFCAMDDQIFREQTTFRISGGCTALVALFMFGKLYVANAGDSRAIICRESGDIIEMSYDFTPETERQRLQLTAALRPELLHNEFTHVEFQRRVNKKDVGKKLLYRDALMNGWAYKTVTEDDLKFPLIHGEGKRTRVLATIGVTRGLGDHHLTVHDSNILIKPFLTSMPQVLVYDLMAAEFSNNDVLVMGCDGLWDVTSHEECVEVIQHSFNQTTLNEKSRYVITAQNLVMNARGLYRGKGWRVNRDRERPASGDDICAFVIPLNQHVLEEKKRKAFNPPPSSGMDEYYSSLISS